jgi:hypothetical protein
MHAGSTQLMSSLIASHQAPTIPGDVAERIELALGAEAARRQARSGHGRPAGRRNQRASRAAGRGRAGCAGTTPARS